jgi:uncharacterized protein DUF4231
MTVRRTKQDRPEQENQHPDPWQAPDPALALALKQVRWYARHRNSARRTYLANEILILLTTASTTVMAALKVTATATASVAASTVVLAGLYKVLDTHENWLAYGSAWADLQVVIHEYRLLPADQRDEDARKALVRSVDEVNSAETGRWIARRRNLAVGGQ